MDNNVKIDESSFEFTQRDEVIYDEDFQMKSVGFFKDAMSRFAKSRVNLVASGILLCIILLSLFVPVISNKNVTENKAAIGHLPPRIPLIEKLGILDGTVTRNDALASSANVDPKSGMLLPDGIDPEFVVGNITNEIKSCVDKDVRCKGGEVTYTFAEGGSGIYETTKLDENSKTVVNEFAFTTGTKLKVNVDKMSGSDVALKIYITIDNGSNYTLIKTINTSGTHEIDVYEISGATSEFESAIRFEFVTSDKESEIVISGASIYGDSNDPVVISPYEMSVLKNVDGDIAIVDRSGAEAIYATFTYDKYKSALAPREMRISGSEFDEISEEHGNACALTPDPNRAGAYTVAEESCPVNYVYQKIDQGEVAGIHTYTYIVEMDYAQYEGYDSMPYFWFGTTLEGFDLFKEVWIGARTSLLMGLFIGVINIVIGIIYGALSGYYGGRIDLFMQRIAEILGRLPSIVVLTIFYSYFGPTPMTIILIIILTGWIGIAYVTRAQFYRYKNHEFVLASRTLGANDTRLIFRHILPNAAGTIITRSILTIPAVIMIESTFSFLGYGIGRGTMLMTKPIELSGVSIGYLLSEGQQVFETLPYLTYAPALVVSVLMITFNMFGNALRDAFNPSLRGSK